MSSTGGDVTAELRIVHADGSAPQSTAELIQIGSVIEGRLRQRPAADASEMVLQELSQITRKADILIVAVGYPELVKCALQSLLFQN